MSPLLAGALALALAACGEDGRATTSGGGAGGALEATTTAASGPGPVAVSSGTDAGSSTTTGAGGANPEDPYGCLQGEMPPRPTSIPEGYRPWACWSQKPQCMLWIPDDPETMVDPITWEPCAAGSPGGEGCRQMVMTWPFDSSGPIGVTYPGAPELDGSGPSPLLRLLRTSLDGASGWIEYLVGEPDGSIRFSLRAPWVGGTNCGFQDYDLTSGFWVMAPYGDDSEPINESDADGLIVVDVEEKRIALPYQDTETSSRPGWRASPSWVTRSTGGKLFLHDHGFTQETLLQDAATDPFGARATSAIFIHGDRVVWSAAVAEHAAIRAYDPVLGPHDLVRYSKDPTHGAGALGSDGVDLVWMEGEGRLPGDISFPIRSVFTAPFTTDPALLEPRRLRSDPSTALNALGDNFHVGCGRAVRHGTTPLDLQIVRLSDGVAWYVDHTPEVWKKSSIVGLTCDEVFLVAQYWEGGKIQAPTIQRIRFDALGEGVPPD